MDDSRLMRSMLLDFYGELLTEKQRECFDLHYNEDLSLAEIAEQLGISRQGVWDNIRRAEASLSSIEEKTGLIRRFSATRRSLSRLEDCVSRLLELTGGEAHAAAAQAAAELEAIKHVNEA